MLTKGMIMVICGVSGVVISFILIIVLSISSARRRKREALENREEVYIPQKNTISQEPFGSGADSTMLLEKKELESTVLLGGDETRPLDVQGKDII